MKNRRLIALSVTAGLLGIASLAYFSFQDAPQTLEARQHLNDLLGNANASEPLGGQISPKAPDVATGETPAAPGSLPEVDHNLFFGFPMPEKNIEVEETASSYVLRIPLASPDESGSVKLNVTPHQIEISGQTAIEEEGKKVSSSFMQSFSTSNEVLPEQVHRLTKRNGDKTQLVITIPKKETKEDNAQPDYDGLHNQPGGGLQSESQSPAFQKPEDNPNPLDSSGNRFF